MTLAAPALAATATIARRDEALLRVENLVVEYHLHGNIVHAVSGVSFEILPGETLGLVGESGCGKSTLGRAVLQLVRPASGRVRFEGKDLTEMRGEPLRLVRRRLQLIFQDPIASLNPRRRIGDIVAEPLVIAGVADRAERQRRVRETLSAVGLDPDLTMGRLPRSATWPQGSRYGPRVRLSGGGTPWSGDRRGSARSGAAA